MATVGGPAPQTSWYQVYEWENYNDVPAFSYTVNNSAITPSFTRILYIFKIGIYSVWIEMDDFTSGDATKIGVPLTHFYEVDVTNLIAKFKQDTFPGADNSTIYNRLTPVTGRINFWPSNYGQGGGNNSLYDHDDSGYSISNGHGSMQFFDMTPSTPTCLFAWNNWNSSGSGEVGMGSQSTGNPDWTFRNNFISIAPLSQRLGRVYVK
jgi:hypothetical protein